MTTHPISPPSDDAMTALRDLFEWAENIATEWDDDLALLTSLLDRSGHVLYLAEDYRGAGSQWRRAQTLNQVRIQNDPDNAEHLAQARNDQVSVLASLSQLYHYTELPHLATDVELELLAAHEAAANRTAVAHALARVGATLLERERHADAETYLTRADRILDTLDANNPELARVHARVLEQLATIHRQKHRPSEARRCDRRSVEVATTPLAPIAGQIHHLKTTVTALAALSTELANEVTTVASAVGYQDRPHLDDLATMHGLINPWRDRAYSLHTLADELTGHVTTLAQAAGQDPAGPTRPDSPDPQPLLTELRKLTDHMAEAATSHRAPDVLIGLFDRAAQVHRLLGDRTHAESLWSRALRLADELDTRADDPAAAAPARAHSIRLLELRRDLYHAWGWLSPTMDVELELLDQHRAANDTPATAHTLARLGAIMIAANHRGTAEAYLTQADAHFTELGKPDATTVSAHTSTLELLGTLYDHQCHPVKATRCRRRAEIVRSQHPRMGLPIVVA